MHHVIYLPGVNTSDPAHLANVGLADHAVGAQFLALPCDRPVTDEHSGGLVVSWGQMPPAAIRDPSKLTWLPAMPLDGLPAERYFVGFDERQPPQPVELLKPHPLLGTPVELAGGRWLIPHAAELPFDIVRDAQTGEIGYELRTQFEPFWRKCLAWRSTFDAWQPEEPIPDVEGQVEFVEEALRINYRLTPELIGHLRLLSCGSRGTLIAALTACLHAAPAGTEG